MGRTVFRMQPPLPTSFRLGTRKLGKAHLSWTKEKTFVHDKEKPGKYLPADGGDGSLGIYSTIEEWGGEENQLIAFL